MLRKLFCGLMAAGMLLATSCQQQEFTPALGEATVTFEVATPEIATRAYSDGQTANQLQYAVYHNGVKSQLTCHPVKVTNGKAYFKQSLTAGETYTIILWADYDDEIDDLKDAPYTVTFADEIAKAKMEVNYNGIKSNDETLDAFYAVKQFTVNGAQTETVELRRPFAQLNIGTNDYGEAKDASGYDPTESSVKVKGIYNTLNLANGDVSGSIEDYVTFKSALIPKGETFPVPGYDYVAMNYVLVGNDNSLVDVEFTLTHGTINKIHKVGSVPVQRNHRTNIYGKLLTSDVDINVEINPEYGGPSYETDLILNISDLQKALNEAPKNATTIINLGADIKGDVTDVQKPGRKVIIDGHGKKYNGSIKVHSNSYYYADAALTIKNLNFETSTASENFIEALENGSERYSSNITVENCTFTATGDAVNTSVGVQVKATRGVTVEKCTATNMHSLIQAQSCDTGDVKVVNCTVNGKNGVAFKQVKSATVEGTTITAAAYGIRFDGNTDNYGITVKDNEVTASRPFIVRKMTGKDNTIALDGTNTLTVPAASISTEAPAYQIVITNGSDDEAYVKPTGTYTLTGADSYLVYPRDVYFFVATWDEFTAALAANEPKIKLTDNIEYSGNYSLKKDVVIDLNGKSITMPMFYVFSTATIMNGTINGKMYARTGCKATLEGLTFSGTISDDLSTEGHLQVQGSCDVYAKNCTFAATTVNGSQTRSLSIEGSSSGIRKFEGCDFKFVSWGTGAGKYKKNVYINTMNGTTTVDFTNCKLNGKAPNIIFAAAYPLTNLTMSGCDNTAPTLEISRAKDTVTEEEWAHISSLIANNKFTQVRVFYAGGSSEYIK